VLPGNSGLDAALIAHAEPAEQYCLKAKECEALAAAMTDPGSREHLRITVRQWLELAEEAELLDRVDVALRHVFRAVHL
jgi:hypothetical protein